LTRVPCPGGSGGGGVGWASLASPAPASTVGSAVWGALACGADSGADGAIAETLTCKILGSSPQMVAAVDKSFMNPVVKMRAIGADPARMVNGNLQAY
jgi:hypothetical protein